MFFTYTVRAQLAYCSSLLYFLFCLSALHTGADRPPVRVPRRTRRGRALRWRARALLEQSRAPALRSILAVSARVRQRVSVNRGAVDQLQELILA